MNIMHVMPIDIDLRLLRVFATLAQVGSFTRTAGMLNVTQSAISHGMRRLEDQLGCTLVYKKGKTTHLTPEGRHFLGQVLRILDSLDRAAESVSSRNESRAKLTVVFSTAMAQVVLAPVLREFRESYPTVSIIVSLEDSPTAVRKVEEGRADLALVVEDKLPGGLEAHPLFRDRLYLMFSPLHPWAEKEAVTTADLKKEHFLLYHRNSVTFRRAEDFFLRSGVGLSSYVEIPSFEIMKQLAKLGLGVALMAPWVAEKELAEGSLIMRPPPRSKIARQWVVIHQGNRDLRKPEQTFIGLCRMASAHLGRRFGDEAISRGAAARPSAGRVS
jgi:LysR family transcriptional regulator, low CO2-responsive transcriptional regulator